jgi:hypothetical protein
MHLSDNPYRFHPAGCWIMAVVWFVLGWGCLYGPIGLWWRVLFALDFRLVSASAVLLSLVMVPLGLMFWLYAWVAIRLGIWSFKWRRDCKKQISN